MFKNRHSIRLKNFDYRSQGAYFITICTKDRKNLLGEIKNGEMILNACGEIIRFTWFDLINHNRYVLLDHFVIMPNHIHGIIIMNNRAGLEPAPTALIEIIRQFKTFSARRINKIQMTPGMTFWQRNYYERVIRNDEELNCIRQYIEENPKTWESDKNYPVNK
ncbi:MAG: transposase [Candidatus Omnitrophica bacterium]|nr:transposase [Candidatus Omnitrophota bacterium]